MHSFLNRIKVCKITCFSATKFFSANLSFPGENGHVVIPDKFGTNWSRHVNNRLALRDCVSLLFLHSKTETRGNLCSQPLSCLIISCHPQPGTNKLKILVLTSFSRYYNLCVTDKIQNCIRLRDCWQYLLPLQNYSDIASSCTHVIKFKTFVLWKTHWQSLVFCCLHSVRNYCCTSIHVCKRFIVQGAWYESCC